MKVGICFYGQPRKYKEVLTQWQKVISELNADVFIHTWYGNDRGKNEIDVNSLVKDFNPKEIKISNPHKFIELVPTDAVYENQSYHAMQQAYSISNCFEILTLHEIALQKNYDVIIKCRMDIELENIDLFIDFIKTNNFNTLFYVAGNHWQGNLKFDDNLMVGNGNLLKSVYLNFYKFTMEFINNTKVIPGGESNVYNWFVHNNIVNNIQKIQPLNFRLLTYNSGESIILNQNES